MSSFTNQERFAIAVDIGNSRIKLFSKSFSYAFKYINGWQAEIIELLNKEGRCPFVIAYSSVNNEKLDIFKRFIGEHFDVEFIDAMVYARNNSQLDFSNITGMGSDRIFGMLGAAKQSKPPFFTVDCGTAITINAVDKDYKCVGGAIFAGAESQNYALGRLTKALSPISLKYSEKAAGENTIEAMNSGIIRSCAAGIMYICEEINQQNLKADIPLVFLTGGAALLVYPAMENWKFRVVISRDIVLKGIYSVFEDFVL